MLNDFSNEYGKLSDEELLLIASDRGSLTEEAAAALDGELNHRNLTDTDLLKYQRFVKRSQQRESRKLRRKVFGNRNDRASWIDKVVGVFCSLIVLALIDLAYQALPDRYHFAPDWQQAAVPMMFATVAIAVAGDFGWRKILFWMSLLISSSLHLLIVHTWMQRPASDGRGFQKLAVLLGIFLFLLLYGGASLLRLKFYGEEAEE